ncbi:MAG: hypothetical protein R3C10_19575 [Pirellulales bacterium]|nr:hypothetical protein [Planctomycetales bacterium]
MKRAKATKPTSALLGIGLDGDDGQTRLTRGNNFVLYGGSDETHSAMQQTAIRVNERLERSGRRLEDVSFDELRDIVADAAD